MSSLARERNMWRIYALEARYELFKMMRLPMYAIPTLAFPLMFYLLFGVALGGRSTGSVTVATYMLATYGSFGIMGISLFGFGVGVAVERGQGWLLFKRATPMPTLAYFAGKLAMVLLFAVTLIAALFTLGATVGGARLEIGQWVSLAAVRPASASDWPSSRFTMVSSVETVRPGTPVPLSDVRSETSAVICSSMRPVCLS